MIKQLMKRYEYDWPMWLGFGPLAWLLDGMYWAHAKLDDCGVSGVHVLTLYILFGFPLILLSGGLTMIWMLTVTPAIAVGAIAYTIGSLVAGVVKYTLKE